jgi:hypothetical protein
MRADEGGACMLTLSPPIQEGISFNRQYLRAKRWLDVLFTLLILPFFFLVAVVWLQY